MPNIAVSAIPVLRASVVALFRLFLKRPAVTKKEKTKPAQYGGGIVGTAFCVVADRYLVTAHHVFNGGAARVPTDQFYAFVVPGNGEHAYHFPVVAFPLERPDVDLAVLEIGPCAEAGVHLPAISVTFSKQLDGTGALTLGFPAPELTSFSVDALGNYAGGSFFLKSHANEGFISANYDIATMPLYELNVGWHHGESGGPIATHTDPPVAFSVMQSYRNVNSPHGVMAGPHRGHALAVIEKELRTLGATVL